MKFSTLTLALCAAAPVVFAAPNLTISTTTTSRDFPLDAKTPLVIPLTKESYTIKVSGIEGQCSAPAQQSIKFNAPIALNCGQETEAGRHGWKNTIRVTFGNISNIDGHFGKRSRIRALLVERKGRSRTSLLK